MSFEEWWKENYPNLNNADAMLVASKAYVDQQAKIDRLEKQLEEADNIIYSIKGIRFATNKTGTAVMVRDSLKIEEIRDDAREYFKNKGRNENKARP